MSARPWMKFYPSDWRADPTLRMCPLAARGLWMEMLCIMHEATPRGFLMVNSSRLLPADLAAISGCSLKDTNLLVKQLEKAGVFSKKDGIIFSRRMVRDEEKAQMDKAWGKQGGNPSLIGRVNPPDKAHILEARSQIPESKTVKNMNGVKKKSYSPPKHGAKGKGFIWINEGTDEWGSYAADYKEIRSRDPIAKNGGKWFKYAGEGH